MGTFPEFNHNEFIGWSSHPVQKPYAVIDLRSSFDHPRVQKRFKLSAKLLSGKRPEPHVIQATGQTHLEQLLWTVLMGDFTSIYLGLLNGLNPAPVELVEKFKKEMTS
jgi:glucose/mannose-6-phosphate isomerase